MGGPGWAGPEMVVGRAGPGLSFYWAESLGPDWAYVATGRAGSGLGKVGPCRPQP
jgi:hypothetical protein